MSKSARASAAISSACISAKARSCAAAISSSPSTPRPSAPPPTAPAPRSQQADALKTRTQSEFARAQTLLELDAISQEEFEQRRQAAAQASAATLASQAALRTTQLELGYAEVRAPITGRISDAHIHAGNLVRAGEDVLTRIVALDPIHFEFAAPESLLSDAEQNPAAGERRVTLQLEGEAGFPHQGALIFVDNAVDPRTGTIRGRATFANDGRFTPASSGVCASSRRRPRVRC